MIDLLVGRNTCEPADRLTATPESDVLYLTHKIGGRGPRPAGRPFALQRCSSIMAASDPVPASDGHLAERPQQRRCTDRLLSQIETPLSGSLPGDSGRREELDRMGASVVNTTGADEVRPPGARTGTQCDWEGAGHPAWRSGRRRCPSAGGRRSLPERRVQSGCPHPSGANAHGGSAVRSTVQRPAHQIRAWSRRP